MLRAACKGGAPTFQICLHVFVSSSLVGNVNRRLFPCCCSPSAAKRSGCARAVALVQRPAAGGALQAGVTGCCRRGVLCGMRQGADKPVARACVAHRASGQQPGPVTLRLCRDGALLVLAALLFCGSGANPCLRVSPLTPPCLRVSRIKSHACPLL